MKLMNEFIYPRCTNARPRFTCHSASLPQSATFLPHFATSVTFSATCHHNLSYSATICQHLWRSTISYLSIIRHTLCHTVCLIASQSVIFYHKLSHLCQILYHNVSYSATICHILPQAGPHPHPPIFFYPFTTCVCPVSFWRQVVLTIKPRKTKTNEISHNRATDFKHNCPIICNYCFIICTFERKTVCYFPASGSGKCFMTSRGFLSRFLSANGYTSFSFSLS